MRIAIIGGGAAGTLAAIHVLDAARRRGIPQVVSVFEPRALLGRGVAYSTTDVRHELNSPASAMGSSSSEPDGFVRWLAEQRVECDPYSFQPRFRFGRYLTQMLARSAAEAGPAATLIHCRQRVIGLEPEVAVPGDPSVPRAVAIRTASGTRSFYDAVILSIGQPAPATEWAPAELRDSPRFIADPWEDGSIEKARRASRPGNRVLLVGTGLTMVDVATSLDRAGLHMIGLSRNGLLPQAHAPRALPRLQPAAIEPTARFAELRRHVLQHISRSRRQVGDWRPGFDSLRPITARLWQSLPTAERREFLDVCRREWDVHRHRLSPDSARRVLQAAADGRLRMLAGEIEGVSDTAGGLRVRVRGVGRRYESIDVGAVVNCTGPQDDFAAAGDPLVDALFGTGLSRPGPLGLGLDTTPAGLLLPRDGNAMTPVWVTGAARRGILWESTAIPELRTQAAEVAAACVDALGS